MKRLFLLAAVVAGCGSSYVQIERSNGKPIYARSDEAERVDAQGMIEVENVLTGKRVRLKRSDCIIREASRSEVSRARGQHFLYE
jgi:hypothetical protein